MKKFLVFLGAVFAILLVGFAAIAYIGMRTTAAVEAEASPYVDELVMAITADWKPGELIGRFTPEARAAVNAQDIESLFFMADKALGDLVDYPGGTLRNFRSGIDTARGVVTTAEFVSHARFERGEADLAIILEKTDGRWMVRYFGINSADLIRHAAGTKT